MAGRLLAGAVVVVAAVAAGSPGSMPFAPGEQASYEVRFMGVPAGVAQITVGLRTQHSGKRVLPLVCVGQTTSVAGVLQINDRFISYYDPQTHKPVGLDYFVDENRKRRRERFRFDTEQSRVFANKKKEGEGPYDVDYEVPANTMDLASATFWLRTQPIAVGAVHEIPIFTGARWYPMKATVEGAETLSTKLGEVPVFRVSITTDFQGNAATTSNVLVYYTADERKLPVRVTAEFVVGSVSADIVQYQPGSASL
ncbi:MAG: DUF3108 domain-containing protein [Myxococcaceae bacterium]|nr:DUF3108 domain-containing protein [Myxococcaceae bacterium]MCA3015155.1 DUF3108 domain-containing protein [Myxococcaceae bacterium]